MAKYQSGDYVLLYHLWPEIQQCGFAQILDLKIDYIEVGRMGMGKEDNYIVKFDPSDRPIPQTVEYIDNISKKATVNNVLSLVLSYGFISKDHMNWAADVILSDAEFTDSQKELVLGILYGSTKTKK